MALLFRADDAAHDLATDSAFGAQGAGMGRMALVFLFVWVALLLAGTLKLDVLTGTYLNFDLAVGDAQGWQAALDRLVPYDAAKGEEGVSVQGVVLIALLASIGYAAWRGFENISEAPTRGPGSAWGDRGDAAGAALAVQPVAAGCGSASPASSSALPPRSAVLGHIVRHRLSEDELRDWLWESWRFVKQIFPLLVVGVFVVGMIRVLIRPEWIEMLAGTNSLAGNLAGVVFGVFMYFPTLVEVPIAKMFLELGMHRGPLLAYLMSDPELSLQSILIISAIIGRKKTFTYVGLVALFSTAAGLIYGAWIDGTALFSLALYLAGFIAALALLLSVASRRAAASSLKGV